MPQARNRSILRVSERFIAAFVAAAVVCVAPSAQAQRPKPKPAPAPAPAAPSEEAPRAEVAQELKLKGDAAFDAREFDVAVKAYEDAYASSKDPSLLYNQGRAYQAMARFPDAFDRIERFSKEASPTLKARVPKLDALLAELREKVAALVVNCNAEKARVIVDKQVAGEVARTGTFRVNAGKVRVEIASDGYLPFTRELDLKGASTTVLDVKLLSRSEAGVLIFKTNPTGANLVVDGAPVGQAPTELVLLSGPHKYTVSREGFESTSASSIVEPGKSKEVVVNLDKEAGVFSKWWFWTAAGVVVVGATALVIVAVSEKDPPTGSLPPGTTSAPLVRF